MIAATQLVGTRVQNPGQLHPVVSAMTPIADANLKACLAVLRESFTQQEASTGDGPDKIAKGLEFVEVLLEHARRTVEKG